MILTSAVQDILAAQFASELAYGVDNYPDGTSPDYKAAADLCLAKAKEAARNGTLTFADLMLGQVYCTLACPDPENLKRQVTAMATQALQWREALDRRVQ